ncbi:hypothetical protein SpCBS45565_g07640 [Spizellomyces sp. 'palustris']|nr:hypothetical protein SpCBS45565_g07640 [Spizellomyces sp. 'palustris']
MKIIIIGGGIGGLSTSIALSQALPGSDIQIYERVTDLRPIGAAISVWSNGVKVLKKLGLGDQIEAYAGDMQRMAYCNKTGEKLCEFSLKPLYDRVKQRACPIARTSLQTVLLEGAQAHDVRVHLGKQAVHFSQTNDQVTVQFKDGEQVNADLLVIAEGTHSKMRNIVAGRVVDRNYVGYVNFNGSVPITPELGDATTWIQFVGDGKRVSMMPMGDDKFYFFFDVSLPAGTTSKPDSYRQELAQHFEGWPDPVQELIRNLDPTKIARVEIHDVEELETFVSGRAVMIGDAAHGTAPDLGQGGCQAMEDGWVLANALKSHPGNVWAALREYDDMRVERTVQLVSRARKRADMIHGKHMPTTLAWYEELARETGEDIMEGMAKTIQGAPKDLE